MNILITRPLIDCEDLMGKFFSLGHKIVHVPTLKISSCNSDVIDSNDYDAFIFTSANAVKILMLKIKIKIKFVFALELLPRKLPDNQDT